jgi:hypothetical protein
MASFSSTILTIACGISMPCVNKQMGGEPHYFEFFLRNAFFLPKQPIVMILDPGEPARWAVNSRNER